MTKRFFLRARPLRLTAIGLPLLALPLGCEPLDAGVLREFAADFARSALAAWLL